MITPKYSLLLSLGLGLVLFGCTSAPVPETTKDGLTRVKDGQTDLVYVLPGAKLGIYKKVILQEPRIAFREGYLSDKNATLRTRRLTDRDLQEMIANGKKLLVEQFTKELTKGGYTVVTEYGADVVAVKVAIVNLDVFAPDPDNMSGIWTDTYTRGAGEATLFIELYDSVTGQLLARAADRKSSESDSFSWRMPRNQNTNTNDARNALGNWAEMLVKGLDRAKSVKAP